MRTTASYELFPDAPSERAIARARYLAREGRVADAEKAYRDVLEEHPDLKLGWAECFELLRGQGRSDDALRLAEAARAQFGDSAFSLALKGAAPDGIRQRKLPMKAPPRLPSIGSSARPPSRKSRSRGAMRSTPRGAPTGRPPPSAGSRRRAPSCSPRMRRQRPPHPTMLR